MYHLTQMPLLRSLLFILVTAFMAAPSAHAGVPPNQYIYLGALTGLLVPTSSSESIQVPVGGSLGFRSSPSFSWGAFIQTSSASVTVVNTQSTAQTSILGGELSYYVDQGHEFTGGFQIGLKAGVLSRRSSSDSNNLGIPVSESVSANGFVIGPKVAYEKTFDMGVAFGIEAIGFYTPSNTISGPIQLTGSVKVWF